MVLLSQPQSYATEEVRKAELLRERGDILIHRNVDLAQASGCYKKALGIARRFPEDENANDVCFACNLGLAQIGTMKWINSRADEERRADRPRTVPVSSRLSTPATLATRLSARQQTPAQTSRFTEGDAHAAILGSLAEEPGGGAEPSATTRMTLQNGQDGDQRAVAALSIEAASALKHSSTRPHAATPPRTGSYVFGPHGTEGISPDKLIAHQRRTLTHSWGPKPSSLLRPCRMREGNVTKRIRMDRDRLAGVGSKKLWAADGNAHAGGDRSGARSATFFRPVPLSVVQQDKRLVGLPLQRTAPVSTDPVRDGNNPAGEWALRQVVAQAGGGGPAISVYGSMGVGIWPRKQRI